MNRITPMLGAGFGPAWVDTQGILSPALPPNRQRQRGILNTFGCMEAQEHPKSCYHERYHGTHRQRTLSPSEHSVALSLTRSHIVVLVLPAQSNTYRNGSARKHVHVSLKSEGSFAGFLPGSRDVPQNLPWMNSRSQHFSIPSESHRPEVLA